MAIDYSAYQLLDDVAHDHQVTDRLYDDYAAWCEAHGQDDSEQTQAEFLAQYNPAR